ncbi:hypothetical protein AB0J38_32790 [Streptomyces sp. NPDC050095]|uniref:hypothetical protein n=1 Tax=unclassified Streptomyces TaxID=2593676 RepID=UPI00341CF7FB
MPTFHRGGNNHCFEKAQKIANMGYADTYTDLGEVLHSEPTAILHGDGTIHVFAIGPNAGLYHLPQLAPNGGWGTWEEISSGSDPLSHRPAAVLNSQGDIEVFARSHNTHINRYQVVNGAWTRTDHDALPLDISGPQTARNADGRLDVFYRGANNEIWHTAEITLGGSMTAGARTRHISLGGSVADF